MAAARRDVTSRGNTIAYLAWGTGDDVPLLLVSGNLQAAEDWVGAGYSDALAGRRVVAVDPLGYGESDKPHDPGEYALADRATDLVAVLDAEGIETCDVWGYSLGGIQGEALRRLYPERTRRLVVGGMVPGLDAASRTNVFTGDAIEVFRSGDWSRVFTEAMPFVDAPMRAVFERRNDLGAVVASLEGTTTPHGAEEQPVPTPIVAYAGTGDWFWEAA